MSIFKQYFSNKFKKTFIATGFVMLALFSSSYVDDYFNISKNLEIFTSVFRQVNAYYVDETKPGELAKTGIDAMLKNLDPYTTYIPESEIEDYRFMTTGQYGGIGSLIRKKGDYIVISEPYEGFAAHKSGLMAGDTLLMVDGKTVKNKKTDEMSKILKGQPGTTITVLIKRDGKEIEKKITREEIKVKAVPYSGILEEGVGYIVLTSFTENCSKEISEAFDSLKKKHNIKSLVLDLRGNPGGLLHESVNIANFFVEKGQEIVSTKGKVVEWQKSYKALNNAIDKDIPLIVLVNKGSASASEIVSGSLQDLDRAVIMGQRTFGKGLVQTTKNLTYNSKLKVTTAKYYVPSGRCIQALDYSHRNADGSVGKVADTLMKAFKTKAGRTVFDGGGIKPDITIKTTDASAIARTLENKLIIFDFAVQYRKKHPSITAAKDFKLNEIEYNEFLSFIQGKDYSYVTSTEKVFKDLKKTMEEEKYLDAVSDEYKSLEQKVLHHEQEDLITFKDDIKKIIEREIVTQYYYQTGKIQYALSNDLEVKKAVELFKDEAKFKSILAGTFIDKTEDSEKQ
ncbi:MAG TPA: S41 family peptidase [Bacteroidia bacterium]|nr:S41 family peptidase [Bacteroidia bacterium]